MPAGEEVVTAYEDAADSVSLREEAGQVETARRALVRIENRAAPGTLVDIGCWTGSFLVAARDRGWEGVGLEPSHWAAARATQRGLDVHSGELFDHDLVAGSYRVAVLCDVIGQLRAPGSGIDGVWGLFEDGGLLSPTLPH